MEKKKKRKGSVKKLISKFEIVPLRFEIRADEFNYILYISNDTSRDGMNKRIWYYGTLDELFKDLFQHLIKMKLATGKNKSMEKIVEIIEKTREEIFKILEPFSEFKR